MIHDNVRNEGPIDLERSFQLQFMQVPGFQTPMILPVCKVDGQSKRENVVHKMNEKVMRGSPNQAMQ